MIFAIEFLLTVGMMIFWKLGDLPLSNFIIGFLFFLAASIIMENKSR